MDSANFHLKRPAGLNKILNTLDLRDNFDRDVYVDFLKRAKASTNNPKGLSIKLGYDDGTKPDCQIRTGSLCSIFFFYTKVQSTFQKVGKSASYEEVENARVSLSFYELLLLCRDFRIIPKFITKEELYFLWKIMNIEKGKAGEKVSRVVSFLDFKDFLARIAILAFNKPGIRRMIMTDNLQGEGKGAKMPSAKELIGMLAKYMHLDDTEWVRNRVRTVGKATVSMINSRSTGEKNLLTRNNLREDLKGTRLAKMLSRESNVSRETPGVGTTSARGGKTRPSSSGPSGRPQSQGGRQSKSQGGKNPSKVAKKLTAAQTQAQALEEKSTLSPFEDQVLLMLKDLERGDDEEFMGGDYMNYDSNDALQEFSQSVAAEEIDVPQGVPESEGMGVRPMGGLISQVQQEALDQYHPSLAMVFDPYSDVNTYKKGKNQNYSNYNSTEVSAQNFLDMGSLVIGSKCVIRLNIVNDTPFEIHVNSAVGPGGRLSNEPVKITTMPTSFCPGLSHSVFLSFIVSETVQNISCNVANIITNCTSPTQPNFHLQSCCPVFFRAIRPSMSTTSNSRASQFPLCDASLLPELLDKFDLKDTLIAENAALRYNPSSNTFSFPAQKDFTHSHKQQTSSFPASASASNLSTTSCSMFDVAPGAVPALVRGASKAALDAPVITRNPTFSTLKRQVSNSSITE